MEDLDFEIQSIKNELVRVALYWNAEKLELGDYFRFSGDEVNEVLLAIRRIKEKKLAELIRLQTQGVTS